MYSRCDCIQTIIDVPDVYRNDQRFLRLASDPAHGGAITSTSLKEAMAILEAEAQGVVPGPVSRDPGGGVDFFDGNGRPIDVKTPPSPPEGISWLFQPVQGSQSILRKLGKPYVNKITEEEDKTIILLDMSYTYLRDMHEILKIVRHNLSDDQRKCLLLVRIPFNIERRNNRQVSQSFVNGGAMLAPGY